jgi:hypothetical protein
VGSETNSIVPAGLVVISFSPKGPLKLLRKEAENGLPLMVERFPLASIVHP